MRTHVMVFMLLVATDAANAQWSQQGSKLVGTQGLYPTQGSSVSLSADGNTAIVGGPYDYDANQHPVGAAWVFTRSCGVWSQQGSKLVGTGGSVFGAIQGISVSLSADGNTAIVGGSNDNGHKGAVWVFTRTGGVWSQQGSKLVGTGAVGTADQGASVSLSSDGNTAIVGGSYDDSVNIREVVRHQGAAWIFVRANGVWTQQGSKLVGTGVDGAARQGTSVSISSDGNTAIVGGPDDDGSGAAWIFTRSGGLWIQQGTKLVGTGAVGAADQGASVSLSSDGNTAVVGGWRDNEGAGAAWVFTRTNGTWSQQGSKLVGTGGSASGQGYSVSLSADGNTAIVGGPRDNLGEHHAEGAAWVFTRSGGVWSQQGSKLVGTGGVAPFLPWQGWSVSLSADGRTAIVGGPGDDSNMGAAWIFSKSDWLIEDANNVPLSNFEFKLSRIQSGAPNFTEEFLGTFRTDATGRIPLVGAASCGYTLGTQKIHAGDNLKFSRVVDKLPPGKQSGLMESATHIALDNAKFDEFGGMSFDALNDNGQDFILDHTELRFNLVVSIEWDAELAYIHGVEQGFRNFSNYLYDVSDGQIRLDTVWIFDDRGHWDGADFKVFANNMFLPHTHMESPIPIANPSPTCVIDMPRKWFGDFDPCRNLSYAEHPIQMDAAVDYRTKCHEFGHYALGFFDEYMFSDGSGNYLDIPEKHCLAVKNYGFMDSQYQRDEPLASEMSSAASYVDAGCRNTKQFGRNKSSCWDFLERLFEGKRGADLLYVPIIKPEERKKLPPGLIYMPGPNEPSLSGDLDYDVGALVQFPVSHSVPNPRTINVAVYDSKGTDFPKAKLVLTRPRATGSLPPLDQGQTSDEGRIYVLGYSSQDKIQVAGSYKILPGLGKILASTSGKAWLYGEVAPGTLGKRGILPTRYTAAGDSVAIYMRQVQGDYPLICNLTLGDGQGTYSLQSVRSFSLVPTLEFFPDDGQEMTYTFASKDSGYSAQVPGNLGQSGIFTLWAVDDSAHEFFISTRYAVSQIDSPSSLQQVIGPEGASEINLDARNKSARKAIVLSSAYPVIQAGLTENAIQAGETQSVSFYPQSSLMGSNYITIHYADSDLKTGSGPSASELSLKVFQWNFASRRWENIGGDVDTNQNVVSAQITQGGVYGAFTTETPVPIQLRSFGARRVEGGGVVIEWGTLSEVNNFGFEIERCAGAETAFRRLVGSFIPGHGTTLIAQHYSYVDSTAGPGKWLYRIRQIDLDGSVHYTDPVSVDGLAGTQDKLIPKEFFLLQNYPNPANPSSKISYGLPRNSHVTLTLYNTLGQQVASLENGEMDAGYYEVQFNGSRLASGVYFYRFQAGDYVATKKLILMK
jgi:hypothetical protein